MQQAGYTDFERGERGSTAQHLSVLDYKVEQESKRLGLLDDEIQNKENQNAVLDKKMEKGRKNLSNLQNQLVTSKKASAIFSEVETIGKANLFGKYELTADEIDTLKNLAKEGLSSRATLLKFKEQLTQSKKNTEIYKTRWEQLFDRTKDYLEVEKLQPEKMKALLDELLAQEPIKQEKVKQKGLDMGR